MREMREREGGRERERERQTQRKRDRQRKRERQTERESGKREERERNRERQRKRERKVTVKKPMMRIHSLYFQLPTHSVLREPLLSGTAATDGSVHERNSGKYPLLTDFRLFRNGDP